MNDDVDLVDEFRERYLCARLLGNPIAIEALLEKVPEHRVTDVLCDLIPLEIQMDEDEGRSSESEIYFERFPDYESAIRDCLTRVALQDAEPEPKLTAADSSRRDVRSEASLVRAAVSNVVSLVMIIVVGAIFVYLFLDYAESRKRAYQPASEANVDGDEPAMNSGPTTSN